MEFEVLLAAGLVLHAHRRCDLRGLHRTLAQHGEFLEHEFQLRIALDHFHHVEHGALAVAAVVVEELDHRDIALRVADRHLPR